MYSQKKFSVNDIYNNSFHQLPSFFFLEDFPKISDKAIILYSLLKSRHELSIKNRWFDKEGNPIVQSELQLRMLIISELAEAMEGFRKNLMDDKLSHRKMEEVELADAVIRALDMMEGLDLKRFEHSYDECKRPDFIFKTFPECLFILCQIISNIECTMEHFVYSTINVARIFDYDIINAINEKRAYNKIRVDHTYEARESLNGKKF